jgi:hypothetical protein
MAADKNSELDTSAAEQPHFPIQKESKKQGFKYPMPSENDRSEATASILTSLNKVDNSVHLNPQTKRRIDTPYDTLYTLCFIIPSLHY